MDLYQKFSKSSKVYKLLILDSYYESKSVICIGTFIGVNRGFLNVGWQYSGRKDYGHCDCYRYCWAKLNSHIQVPVTEIERYMFKILKQVVLPIPLHQRIPL